MLRPGVKRQYPTYNHNNNHHNCNNSYHNFCNNNQYHHHHHHSIDKYGLGWHHSGYQTSEPQSPVEKQENLELSSIQFDSETEVQQVYLVEAIRGSKYDFRRRKFGYLIKWLYYPEQENTYEYDVSGCEDLVVDFWETKALKELTNTSTLKKNTSTLNKNLRKKIKKKIKQSQNRRMKKRKTR